MKLFYDQKNDDDEVSGLAKVQNGVKTLPKISTG